MSNGSSAGNVIFHLYGFPTIDWLNIDDASEYTDPLSLTVRRASSQPHVTPMCGGIAILRELLPKITIDSAHMTYNRGNPKLDELPPEADDESSAKTINKLSPKAEGFIHHTSLWSCPDPKKNIFRLINHRDIDKTQFKTSEVKFIRLARKQNDYNVLVTDTSEVFCYKEFQDNIDKHDDKELFDHFIVRVYPDNIIDAEKHSRISSFLFAEPDAETLTDKEALTPVFQPWFREESGDGNKVTPNILPITVLINLRDLRDESSISRSLSWNLLAVQVYEAVREQFVRKRKDRSYIVVQNVIVVVRLEGAFVFRAKENTIDRKELDDDERRKDPYDVSVVFDQHRQEDDYDRPKNTRHMRVLGYSVCMTAALCALLKEKPQVNDLAVQREENMPEEDRKKLAEGKKKQMEELAGAVKTGIRMMRRLYYEGYRKNISSTRAELVFPFDAVCDSYLRDEDTEQNALTIFPYNGRLPKVRKSLLELVAENPKEYPNK